MVHLSWNNQSRAPPRLILCADTPTFDTTILEHWKEEGFAVAYFPFDGNTKEYTAKIGRVGESLQFGEEFAIIGELRQKSGNTAHTIQPIHTPSIENMFHLLCFDSLNPGYHNCSTNPYSGNFNILT